MSQSWFCKWKIARPGLRAQRQGWLKAEVARLFTLHEGKYGPPRITADLRGGGWQVSENTVAGLMRELGGLPAAGRYPADGPARAKVAAWIADDNTHRQHSACQMMPPVTYGKQGRPDMPARLPPARMRPCSGSSRSVLPRA